jgi:hypothetical protein
LKQCFQILLLAPEYSLDIQAQIPAALSAIHDFIYAHDPMPDHLPQGDSNIQTHDNTDDNTLNFPMTEEADGQVVEANKR